MDLSPENRRENRNLIIYGILVAAFVVTCFLRAIFFMQGASKVRLGLGEGDNVLDGNWDAGKRKERCALQLPCPHVCRHITKASYNLNKEAFNAVVHSPIRFFDTNPIGRILNRFSKVCCSLVESSPAQSQRVRPSRLTHSVYPSGPWICGRAPSVYLA